ncbi:hypothetical protein N0V90_001658 [Kalmusia sp. IMI 367209]|nr:hypothetical protein N0V90_001658 [Kalmusia sp. IMI 367209]
MDTRRPVRPAPSTRRALFHTTTARAKPAHPPSKTTVHIASETASPADDLVERDAAGNYKILAPTTAMKMGVDKGTSPEEEEKDQEDQMIALYGRSNCHWDQAAILEEIKVALRASLERKVQSLDVDRWMFEGEGGRKV